MNDTKAKQGDNGVLVLIEQIRGLINVIDSKVDGLVALVERLNETTITREELKLTIDPMEVRIKTLEKFRDGVFAVIGVIAFAVVAMTIAKAIPGINL